MDGCQYGLCDDYKEPVLAHTVWLSNYDTSPLMLRCRRPHALVGCGHYHSCKAASVQDNAPLGTAYAQVASHALASLDTQRQYDWVSPLTCYKPTVGSDNVGDLQFLDPRSGDAVQFNEFLVLPIGMQHIETGVVHGKLVRFLSLIHI